MDLERAKQLLLLAIDNKECSVIVKNTTYEERLYMFSYLIESLLEDDELNTKLTLDNIHDVKEFYGTLFTEEEAITAIVNKKVNIDSLIICMFCVKNEEKIQYLIEFVMKNYEIAEFTEVITYYSVDPQLIIDYLDEKGKDVDSYHLSCLIEHIDNDEIKIKTIEKYKDRINDYQYLNLGLSFNSIEYVLKFCNLFSDKFSNYFNTYGVDFPYKVINEKAKNIDDVIKLLRFFSNLLDSMNFAMVIETIEDDTIKIKLIDAFEIRDISQLFRIINSISDNRLRLEQFYKFQSDFEKNDLLGQFIEDLTDDEIKTQLLVQFVNVINLDAVEKILCSFKDDTLKINNMEKLMELKNSTSFVSPTIVSINDENTRIEIYKKYKEHFDIAYFIDLLSTIDSDEIKYQLIINYLNNINSFKIEKFTNVFDSDEYRFLLLEQFDSLIDGETIYYVSLQFADNRNISRLIKKYINLLDKDVLKNIIEDASEEYKYELLDFLGEPKLKTYYSCGLCYSLPNLSMFENELKPIIDDILKIYDGKEASVSDLKALIGLQAREIYEREKKASPLRFLPDGFIHEIIALSKGKDFKELLLDQQFIQKYNKIKSILVENFDDKTVLSSIINYSGVEKKSDREFLKSLLKALNIKEIQMGNKSYSDLLDAFIDALQKEFEIENINISDLYSQVDANDKNSVYLNRMNTIKRVYNNCINRLIERSLLPKNKEIGGLLSQICITCTNIEKRLFEQKQKEDLEKRIKKHLLVTDKGKELINKRRVEAIIKKNARLKRIFEDPNIKFNIKMDEVFKEFFPTYFGKKNINVLYSLMIDDQRFKVELTSDITPKEIDELPFEIANFKVNMKAQKHKLVVAILKSISRDDIDFGTLTLNPEIIKRLNVIKENLKGMKLDSNQLIPLLLYGSLDLVSNTNIENLILYYSSSKKYHIPRDKNGKPKALNIDNLRDYLLSSKKMSMRNTKEYIILGEDVIDVVDQTTIKDCIRHYTDAIVKRFYRTIPSVSGKFETDGNEYIYSSYDVCDPEQLIAGARMTSAVCTSCFQIGHAQSDTIKYITSSPNGIIVAIKDSTGKFLGRVYGYRIGNAVHFTRIYYNIPFDFETAMERIANDIISKSKEIDYVTCIPYTSARKEYMGNNKVYVNTPDEINRTQEGYYLYTDHGSYESICIVASRKPVAHATDVKFNREESKEKFYKPRRKAKTITIEKDADLNAIDDIVDVKKIIYSCNVDHNIIMHLSSARKIVYGEDWVIIDIEGRDPIIIKVDYGDIIEYGAIEYNNLLFNEINEALKLLMTKREEHDIVDSNDEPSLGGI